MSGGERGSRLECNAQTHTYSQTCTNTHIQESTHKHIAFLPNRQCSRDRQLPSFSCLCDFSFISSLSLFFFLFALSCFPRSLSGGFSKNKWNGGQRGKLLYYNAHGLVNIKPGKVDRSGYKRVHVRTVGLSMSLYSLNQVITWLFLFICPKDKCIL